MTVKKETDRVTFTVSAELPTRTTSGYNQVYTVYGTGDVEITSTLKPGSADLPMIPEIGNMLTIPKDFSNIPGTDEDRKKIILIVRPVTELESTVRM